jgi:hypothetical protein
MATQTNFEKFSEDKLSAKHNFFGGDVIKVMLTNTAPDSAADTVVADITEIASGNGYTAGGEIVSYTATRSGGTSKITATDMQISASGGSIGPFQFFVFYNFTSANGPLISTIDRGSAITLNDGDVENIDFDDVNGFFDET